MPLVTLPTTWGKHIFQVDPGLANQVRLLIVVEDRHLQLLVVRRLVNGESKFLVPNP